MKSKLFLSNATRLPTTLPQMSRRRFVTGLTAGSAFLGLGLRPSLAISKNDSSTLPITLSGSEFDLSVDYQSINFTGRERMATAINGSVPSPILRWKEGDRVTLRVLTGWEFTPRGRACWRNHLLSFYPPC